MNLTDHNRWKSDVVDEIFKALAASRWVAEFLVFKGARILNLRLRGLGRQSLDLDGNLCNTFVEQFPDRTSQKKQLERQLSRAIRRHFEGENPVQYSLTKLTVKPRPRNDHPRGWNAFDVVVSVTDLARQHVRGLPRITLDIAAPEQLLSGSTAPLTVGRSTVSAYTLERMAGEKLRAFLSSLPAYRNKMSKPGDAVRVKDIYDVARIHREHPLSEGDFWRRVGREFRAACDSRLIDCHGLQSFEEDLSVTRETYEKDAILPRDIPFENAWKTIRQIIAFLEGG